MRPEHACVRRDVIMGRDEVAQSVACIESSVVPRGDPRPTVRVVDTLSDVFIQGPKVS